MLLTNLSLPLGLMINHENDINKIDEIPLSKTLTYFHIDNYAFGNKKKHINTRKNIKHLTKNNKNKNKSRKKH